MLVRIAGAVVLAGAVLVAGPARAAVALLQSDCVQQNSTANVNLTLTGPASAGTTVVMAYHGNVSGGTVASVTDDHGNSYQRVFAPYEPGGFATEVWYARNDTAGSLTVQVTLVAVVAGTVVYVHEYSGLDPVDPVLTFTTASGGSASSFSSTPIFMLEPGVAFLQASVSTNVSSVAPPFVQRESCWGDFSGDAVLPAGGPYQADFTASAPGP